MAWPTFRFKPVTVFTTTLDGAITASTDPINVVSNTLAADGPGLLKLENEIIKYTTKGANQFSGLTRGYDSTTAAGHATGITVTHPIAGDIFANLWDGVEYLKGVGSGQTTVEFGLPITSDTDNTDDIGSSSKAWKDLYLKGSIKRAAVTVFSIDADSIITFGLFPITPSSAPTTDYQVANKKYVTDNAVFKTGAQTIAGVKSFDDGAIVHVPEAYTPSGGGTATLDLSKGNKHDITMPAGNITIAISNATVGQAFIVSITQDSVGSRTVTWFTTIRWADGSAPTLTTTANKRDIFGFIVTGSGTYDGFVVGQNI